MTTFPLQTKIYTVEDLENLSNEDGAKYELYDGELTLMPPSQRNATELGVEIASLLRNFTRGKGFGYIAGADGGYILSREPDTFVSPDASFISKERAGERKSTGCYPVAPDLAVEVISPSDRAADIRRKDRPLSPTRYTSDLGGLSPDTHHRSLHINRFTEPDGRRCARRRGSPARF